tara:strand:+ start:424 stop:615 length:192 start_codon:yes stop_codon:yes gene_type:complete
MRPWTRKDVSHNCDPFVPFIFMPSLNRGCEERRQDIKRKRETVTIDTQRDRETERQRDREIER